MATTFLEAGTDATQDFSLFSLVTGSVTSDTGQSHTGPRSIKCFTSSPATIARVRTPNGTLADSGTQISFYFRFDTLPAASEVFAVMETSGASVVINFGLTTTGKIINQPAGATQATGTHTLSIDTWYRLCISYYITNTTTYQCKVYVDGNIDSTTNAGTLTNTGTSNIQLATASAAGANVSSWFDDIYIATGGASSSSQPDTGNILVTNKRPFSNGTSNQYTTGIGADPGSPYGSGHAVRVNEQPLSTTNGWSIQNAANQTEEYTIENASTGDVNITGATITDYMGWVYTKVGSASTGNIIVNNVATNISVTTSYKSFMAAAGSTSYPGGNTDIGVDTNTVNQLFSLAECGIQFAYTPASGTVNVPYNGKNLFQLMGVGI